MRFTGTIDTVFDAFLLAELAKTGHHPLANVRLNEFASIEAGTVIVFDKTETGMSRWIDGKSWSPSRFKGGFFTYMELMDKKPTGLLKKAISVQAPNGHQIHIIAYYNQLMPTSTLTQYMDQIREREDIYQEAKNYRYFKCFRSQSKGWRKPCPYPTRQSSSPTTDFRPINLPKISSLNLSYQSHAPSISSLNNEDAKQLKLLASYLSF